MVSNTAPPEGVENVRRSRHDLKKYVIQPTGAVRWFLVGKTREYFLSESTCTCHSFMINKKVGEERTCKHLILLKEAKEVGLYDEVILSVQEYVDLRPYLYQKK